MCGIAGILRVHPPGASVPPHERAIPEAWLDLLDASIKHRGPDGQGRFRDRAIRGDGSIADVALVHRRLSIIDHAGGAQPMVSLGAGCFDAARESAGSPAGQGIALPALFHGRANDPVVYRSLVDTSTLRVGSSSGSDSHRGLLAVAFNGCIYNHRELRHELAAAGHAFASDHSDTEVLLHAWRRGRFGMQARLEGMYAVALWDRDRADAVLMCDRFAEKPLYCTTAMQLDGSTIVAWSSSFASLVQLRSVLRQAWTPDATLPWIQFGWNQTQPTRAIEQVQPGEGRCPLGAEGEERRHNEGYWFDVLNPRGHTLSADEVDAALRRSVHARLEADVPLGVFLSGGIDSALIARYAREIRPDIAAFTVRMPSAEYDESDAARETARELGINHTLLDCRADAAHDLVRLIEQLGLPFGDSSLLPSAWVADAARRHIKVALGGDGGDDLFLGYERQAYARLLSLTGNLDKDKLEFLAGVLDRSARPKSMHAKAARFVRAAAGSGYKDLVAVFPSEFMAQLAPSAGRPGSWTGHFGLVCLPHPETSWEEQSTLARRFDAMFYLPFDLLRKSDTASMASALELRAPMLDSTVASLAIHASRESLMPRGERKGLLRALARRYFPRGMVDRPKMGFAIPVGEWFRTDFGGMKTLLLDTLHSADPFPADVLGLELNRAFIRRMFDEHTAARRDHSQRLYMLLVLAIWARWIRGQAGTQPTAI